MSTASTNRVAAALVGAVGAVVGFVAASIVIFNVHTIVGLEEGYGATPSQVMDHSLILAVADVMLLGAGLAGGALAGLWLHRSWRWRER